MNNTELKELIEDCCNDIFDRLEPLANVKSRLYTSLNEAINYTHCCTELKTVDNDEDWIDDVINKETKSDEWRKEGF